MIPPIYISHCGFFCEPVDSSANPKAQKQSSYIYFHAVDPASNLRMLVKVPSSCRSFLVTRWNGNFHGTRSKRTFRGTKSSRSSRGIRRNRCGCSRRRNTITYCRPCLSLFEMKDRAMVWPKTKSITSRRSSSSWRLMLGASKA